MGQEVGDVEFGCTIAEQMLDSAVVESGISSKDVIAPGVVDSGALCAAWCKHISAYAEKYIESPLYLAFRSGSTPLIIRRKASKIPVVRVMTIPLSFIT